MTRFERYDQGHASAMTNHSVWASRRSYTRTSANE